MKIYPYFVSHNLFICILKVANQNFKAIGYNLSVQDVVVECCFDALRDTDTFHMALIHLGGGFCAPPRHQDYTAQQPFAHLHLATSHLYLKNCNMYRMTGKSISYTESFKVMIAFYVLEPAMA